MSSFGRKGREEGEEEAIFEGLEVVLDGRKEANEGRFELTNPTFGRIFSFPPSVQHRFFFSDYHQTSSFHVRGIPCGYCLGYSG